MIEPLMRTPPADVNAEVTAEYTEAFNLNAHIKLHAQAAQGHLYRVCTDLKRMHERKLYMELGYQSFEDYCDGEIGMSRHMAYKYIAVAEMKNVESIQQIGITKLALLAKLDEPEREQIAKSADLENASVRELKQKISDLKSANERLLTQIGEAEDKAEKCRASEAKTAGQLSIVRTDKEMLEARVGQLENEIRELEARPIEVAVADNSREVENLKKAMQKVDLEWGEKYGELEEQSIKERRELMQAHQKELEEAKADYEQRLKELPQSTDERGVFKAYLKNAIDAIARVLEFVSTSQSDDRALFIGKTKTLSQMIDTKLGGIENEAV